ncbi:MAG: squalene/phytoene synthase family protein [Hyphomonadaceae bacterium]|nr:squalene/phytoene synthase family protein [Hyphomonadaceae bacterium]
MPTEDLDTLVRRVDEDRWLATRFAPPPVRARLIAMYAVNYEIARLPETVREAPLGAIRLEWWRSALSEGALQAHPALEALRASGGGAVAGMLAGIAEARGADFEIAPFATWTALENYVAGTARTLIAAAVEACDVGALGAEQEQFVDRAALAWAYAGLLRAAPYWAARGRRFLPNGATEAEMLQRARGAYAEAKTLAPKMPAAAFPAFGYVALAPGYMRALQRGRREQALLWRQASLVAASATGRI